MLKTIFLSLFFINNFNNVVGSISYQVINISNVDIGIIDKKVKNPSKIKNIK